ncbi:MAG: hypothetical protein HY703_08120, partial [Gemmatimonadetes bacterium]|nr:hypothetical protein [Gemmatimonadota bacterium]
MRVVADRTTKEEAAFMAVRVAEAPWRAGHGRNPLRGRLSRRLLVWFLVLSLAPLFVSNTVGYVRSQGIVERLVQRYVSVIAEVEARHIRDQVQRHVLGLQAIAAGNEFLAAGAVRLSGGAAGPMGVVADRAALERHLSRKLGELRVFDVLYLQSVAGRVLAATAPLDSQLVAAWAPGLVPPAFQRLRPAARVEAPRFRLTAPVLGRAGKTVAFLVGVVGPGRLPVFLEVPERLGGALEGAIVDENG